MTTIATPGSSSFTAAGAEPLRVERHFRAPPERVFRAWTTAAELSRWSDPDPQNAQAEVDLRVGGRYQIAMTRAGGTVHRVTGVYREIDPPHRLVYTWRWESNPGFPETTVTVEFRGAADGGTDLLLVHAGLPDTESGRRHAHGWTMSLEKLASVSEAPDPLDAAAATRRARLTDLHARARAYVEAAGTGAPVALEDLLHPDVEFQGPYVTLQGAPAYVAALARLAPIRVRHDVRKTFVEGTEACVLYEFVTDTAAGVVPMIEWLAFEDGRVRSIRLYFDREQFAPARAELARRAGAASASRA